MSTNQQKGDTMRKLAIFLSLLVGVSLITTLADPPLAQAQMTSVQMGIDGMICDPSERTGPKRPYPAWMAWTK